MDITCAIKSSNVSEVQNWYDWQTTAPEGIFNTLLIMYPYKTTTEKNIASTILASARTLIDKICPNNVGKTDEKTISYRRNRLGICPKLAALTSDTALIEECRTNLSYFMLEDQGKANGLQEDGSYIYHDYWPMEGMYANGYLVEQTLYVYSALSGTAFAVGGADVMADWMLETFQPVMHKNVVLSMNSGRNPVGGLRYGRITLNGALRLVDQFDADTNLRLRQFIRSMIVGDTEAETQKSYSYIATKLGSVFLVQNLKSAIMDSTISDAEQEYASVRYTTDRVVQHQEDHTVGLSMSST